MEAVGDDSTGVVGGSLDAGAGAAPAAIGRCGEAACNLNKMEKALRGTFLDIHSSNESTIHPANGLLMQALQSFYGSTYMVEPYCRMLHCWASELEKDGEMMCQGEKGRKHIFMLNNIYDVLQTMRRPGPTFADEELVSRLISLIQTYKKSYFAQCWVPLSNQLHLNFDEFTAEFLATCDNQRTWKVTAELKYKLREEIVGLIVPPYEVSLAALSGNKKQKKFTGEELKKEIIELFEG